MAGDSTLVDAALVTAAVAGQSGVGKWLVDYSGTLSAAASIVLILVTGAYVRLTHTLADSAQDQLDEARRSRLDARMPTVVGTVTARPHVESDRSGIEVLVLFRNRSEPAEVDIYAPEEWQTPDGALNEPADDAIYLELAPDESLTLRFFVPIDPEDTGLRHLMFDALVMPRAGGVIDEFTWFEIYDPATRDAAPHVTKLSHERRRYTGIKDRPTSKPKRRLPGRWQRHRSSTSDW